MPPERQTNEAALEHAWVRRATGAVLLGATAAGVVAGVGAEPAAAYENNPDGSITVERGDTSWDIAMQETGASGGELIKQINNLATENRLADPNVLVPGQRLTVTSLHPENGTEPSGGTYTLKYRDTLWDTVKEHYGYVTASLVEEVARNSGINMDSYFPGEVVKFPGAATPAAAIAPEVAVPQAPDTKVTISSQNQTIWALANFVAAANNIPHAQAVQATLDANPGVNPRLIQLGDQITLPGVSDREISDMVKAIVHYSDLQRTVPAGGAVVPTRPDTLAERAAEQPQDATQLAQAVLHNPNITIQSSPNDRVRKSVENIQDDGETFTHDVSKPGEVQVSSRLLQTLQGLAMKHPITITSLTTGEHSSNSDHYKGEAVDIQVDGNSPDVFKELYDNREQLEIDELIWEGAPEGTSTLNDGQPFDFDAEVLEAHKTHIHLSVKSKDPLPQPEAPATPEVTVPQNTYIIGDSISAGLRQVGLEEKLQAKLGGQVMIDSDSGRSITQPGTDEHQSALEAVDTDQEFIKSSKNIVIVLGTNPTDSPFADNLKALLTKMKALAPGANYYVVDIGATRESTVEAWNERNRIIYENAEPLGYNVISRAKALFGAETDPLNLPAGADIPGGGDDVHGGYDKLAAVILWSVGNPPTPECVSTSELIGADNGEKIYNFLVMKGLTPQQAAGVMGNLQAESGFEPGRVQYGGTNSRGERSVAGEASSLDSTMRIDGVTGYGIAQWTSQGRQQGLHDFAVSRGTSDGDLATQLEWLYKEATERGDWEKLQQAGDPGQAAYSWHKYYEISADGPERIQNRMNFANDILLRYQNLTPPKAC